jgi:tripartite ATP-independent transporter DctM subunit
MTPIEIGIAGIILLLIVVFSGVPVGLAMGTVGFVGILYQANSLAAFQSVVSTFYDRFSSYELTVIPSFILMGLIMFKAGAGRYLFSAANTWIGHWPGGLAIATIAACAGFSAISGSAIAATATIGAVALPEMLKHNYPKSLAAGSVAAGGTLDILIPPSVTLIIYSILVNESISALFIAGIAPGLLLATFFCVTIFIVEARRRGSLTSDQPSASWNARFRSLSGIWDTALLFIFVIGGMFVGVFTPNEAGAAGSLGALALGLIRRTLTWRGLTEAIGESVKTATMVVFIIFGAAVFSTFLTLTRIPFTLADTIAAQGWPDLVVLGVIILIYVVGGMVMEILPLIIVTVPIFAPVVTSLGYDLIWFGILIVLLGQLGMITPPVGISVFVVGSLRPDINLSTVFRGVTPFAFAIAAMILLLIAVPRLATFLPDMMR